MLLRSRRRREGNGRVKRRGGGDKRDLASNESRGGEVEAGEGGHEVVGGRGGAARGSRSRIDFANELVVADLLPFPSTESLVSLGVLTLVDLLPSDVPRPLVAGVASLLEQTTEELRIERCQPDREEQSPFGTHGTLAFGIGRHLVHDDLQQVVVRPIRDSKVLARALLELGVKNSRVALEDGDNLLADLGEQVEPLEVGGEEEGSGRGRAKVGAGVEDRKSVV